jgi:hypothetical protein
MQLLSPGLGGGTRRERLSQAPRARLAGLARSVELTSRRGCRVVRCHGHGLTHRRSMSRPSRASPWFRRFQVKLDDFEPKVLDSVEQAVQGRLVGASAPHDRRIAHDAHLHIVEGRPHPGTRDTANGDHAGATGYFSRFHHLLRNR